MKLLTVNEGKVDRVIRVLVGLALLYVGYVFLTGFIQIIAYVAGTISLITGLTGFCGVYTLLGINTCPRKR